MQFHQYRLHGDTRAAPYLARYVTPTSPRRPHPPGVTLCFVTDCPHINLGLVPVTGITTISRRVVAEVLVVALEGRSPPPHCRPRAAAGSATAAGARARAGPRARASGGSRGPWLLCLCCRGGWLSVQISCCAALDPSLRSDDVAAQRCFEILWNADDRCVPRRDGDRILWADSSGLPSSVRLDGRFFSQASFRLAASGGRA